MDGETKIEVLWSTPVIFTRDRAFVESVKGRIPFNAGDVVLLPSDAVLARVPMPTAQSNPPGIADASHSTDNEPIIG